MDKINLFFVCIIFISCKISDTWHEFDLIDKSIEDKKENRKAKMKEVFWDIVVSTGFYLSLYDIWQKIPKG